VSILTEGWDVHNVFQVIPHEKRAFDSKLLIAQVLGRGLRLPEGMSQPVLRVFNHASWSSEIVNLVREVIEEEPRVRSYPVLKGEHAKHHFSVHQLRYETETTATELTSKDPDGQVNLFTRGFVQLESQSPELERQTEFASATTDVHSVTRTNVHVDDYPVDVVVQNMFGKLKAVDLESGSRYAKDYPRKKLREVVEASLAKIGEERSVVTEPNVQRLLRAMGNIRREVARTVRIDLKPLALELVPTKTLRTKSVALASFMKEATIFYDAESKKIGEDADRKAVTELADEDALYPNRATRFISNKFWFKSPVNVVLTTHEPERAFVARLMEPEVAAVLRLSWIKSADTGFYEINYSWRRGDHTKQGRFNPDMFLWLADGREVLVVELKTDGEVTDENRAKLRFATEHFNRINARQSGAHYSMKFLSPESYDAFFGALKAGQAVAYMSSLQATLSP